jgi:hypothetical protein
MKFGKNDKRVKRVKLICKTSKKVLTKGNNTKHKYFQELQANGESQAHGNVIEGIVVKGVFQIFDKISVKS